MRADSWLEYADRDRHGAQSLFAVGDYNLVCFHAAQAAEKYMQAVITQLGNLPPKTHVLFRLNEIVQEAGINLGLKPKTMATLSQHAVLTRYPQQDDMSLDELYSEDDASDALEMLEQVMNACRSVLEPVEESNHRDTPAS